MVETAIAALKAFGAVNRTTARNLLAMWAHRDSLSPEQVKQVLRAFRAR